MTEKRFTYKNHKVKDNLTGEVHSSNMVSVNVLNRLDNELLNCRAENTKLKLILKDVVNDLKRMNTRGVAEHIENIVNLDFGDDEMRRQYEEIFKGDGE